MQVASGREDLVVARRSVARRLDRQALGATLQAQDQLGVSVRALEGEIDPRLAAAQEFPGPWM